MKTTFTACKYLDYTTNYLADKKLLGNGKVYWLRPAPYEGAPTMVQFCSLRGRLNTPEACHCAENARCNLYEEGEHAVNVEEQ